jgi:N-acetylglucosaminyl-diphospho-decaprenol L-rhamnosyltransferase
MPMSVQTSIVIINHDSGPTLAKMLTALQLEQALTTEIIVVDAHSRDDSVPTIKQQFPTVRLIQMPHNRGWAAAANRGMRDALGDVVIVCHADIIAPIFNLLEMSDQVREGAGKRVAMMLPRLIDAQGSELPFVARLPGLSQNTIGLFNPSMVRRLYVPSLDHVADHEWAILPCAAFNAELLQKIGEFDDRFFLYYADADLCLRIHEREYRIGISRNIRVAHLSKSEPLNTDHVRLMRKDHERYIQKHRPAWERGWVSLYGMLHKNAG